MGKSGFLRRGAPGFLAALLVGGVIAVSPASATGGNRYVATTGSDTGDCSVMVSPCLTVNYAVSQANEGDTINVGAGAYGEIVGTGKALTFKGANAGIAGAGVRGPESTIKGLTGPLAGSITDASSTTYSGSISNATYQSTITDVLGASGISAITSTNPIQITTTKPHGQVTGNTVNITGVTGTIGAGTTLYANGTNMTITVIDANNFTLNGRDGSGKAWTSGTGTMSNGIAKYLTSAPHGLVAGAKVTTVGITGTTTANVSSKAVASTPDSSSFTLYTSGVTPVRANAVYGSGGTVTGTQIVIETTAPHGIPVDNAAVTIAGVTGNTNANGVKTVTVLDATHFMLNTPGPTAAYTGGGTFTSTPVVLTTAAPHGLTGSALSATILDVGGNTAANGAKTLTVLDSTHLGVDNTTANGTYTSGGVFGNPVGTTITGATNASPIVITSKGPHGLTTGSSVTIAGATVNTAANGTFTVTAINATQFSLDGSTGNGAGTNGTWAPVTNVTLDGFTVDPQGDVALVSVSAQALVRLFGGTINVTNNVFNGGSFVTNCTYTCTTMTDYAFQSSSGDVAFSNNKVQNFRRPINVGQSLAPATAGTRTVTNNTVTGITSRGLSLAGSSGVQASGVTVSGNTFDATGITSPSTPAGITISNGANTISGNSFTGLSSGVYVDLCKKFLTTNNAITGNTFTGNGLGVYVAANSDGGQCATGSGGDTEGVGSWVTGGGTINGMSITGNQFLANSTGVYNSTSGWAYVTANPPISTGPIDTTCNYWNSPTGPTNAGNPGGTGDALTVVGPNQVTHTFTPWNIAPAGPCTGGLPATVTAVSPTSGPTAGGTSVTITGTNLTGTSGVSFGGSAGTSVTVVSDTSVTVTSPAHVAGPVDVTVTTPAGTSAVSAGDVFTFVPPAVPTLAVGNAQGLERDLVTGSVFVPVSLSQPSATNTVVSFYTVNGTAIAGTDYSKWGTPTSPRTITIPAGSLQSTINVPVLVNHSGTSDTTFSVVVSAVSGGDAVLGANSTGTATIINSDGVSGTNPAFNVTSVKTYEGNSGQRLAQFQVQLSRPTATAIQFTYNSTDGTAVAPGDYKTILPGTITFAPGQISKTIDVVYYSDTVVDGDKDFSLEVTVIGGSPVEEINTTGVATIADDD